MASSSQQCESKYDTASSQQQHQSYQYRNNWQRFSSNLLLAILGTVLEHLSKEGLVGKREVAFFDRIKVHVSNGFELMKEVFIET